MYKHNILDYVNYYITIGKIVQFGSFLIDRVSTKLRGKKKCAYYSGTVIISTGHWP